MTAPLPAIPPETPEQRLARQGADAIREALVKRLSACTESRATCGKIQPCDRCRQWDCCDNLTVQDLVRPLMVACALVLLVAACVGDPRKGSSGGDGGESSGIGDDAASCSSVCFQRKAAGCDGAAAKDCLGDCDESVAAADQFGCAQQYAALVACADAASDVCNPVCDQESIAFANCVTSASTSCATMCAKVKEAGCPCGGPLDCDQVMALAAAAGCVAELAARYACIVAAPDACSVLCPSEGQAYTACMAPYCEANPGDCGG